MELTNTSATHEKHNIKPHSFRYNKRQLRMFYKLLKAGMIKPEEVPTKFRGLLVRYYGIPSDLWSKHEPESS